MRCSACGFWKVNEFNKIKCKKCGFVNKSMEELQEENERKNK